jgi:hypothetical protein
MIPVTVWPGVLIALTILAGFSWLLVRHIGLALLVAFSPLPGFVLTGFAIHHPPSVFGYFPGFIAAGFFAGTIAPLTANMSARVAIGQSLRDLWRAFLAILILFIPAAFLSPSAFADIATEISAVAITAIGAMLLPYGENFVVRINRAQEARLRETERLAFLTTPRWGASISGVALVFSVLGFFGAQKAVASVAAHPALFIAMTVLFLAGAFVTARNVRRALAAFLALMPVALLMMGISDRFTFSPLGLLAPLATAAMFVLLTAATAFRFEQNGDGPLTATLRGMEQVAPAAVVVAIASVLAGIVFLSQAAIIESAAILLGAIAALILQPALATFLYSLFPKRVSLDEAFRRR